MPFKVSFVLEEEEQAQTFVNDIETTGSFCYVDSNGDEIEHPVTEAQYEAVSQ